MEDHVISIRNSFPVALVVKNPPANEGDLSSILGLDDPLEEETAAHSSTVAWRIPWPEEPGGLQSMKLEKSRTGPGDSTATNRHHRISRLRHYVDSSVAVSTVPSLYSHPRGPRSELVHLCRPRLCPHETTRSCPPRSPSPRSPPSRFLSP